MIKKIVLVLTLNVVVGFSMARERVEAGVAVDMMRYFRGTNAARYVHVGDEDFNLVLVPS